MASGELFFLIHSMHVRPQGLTYPQFCALVRKKTWWQMADEDSVEFPKELCFILSRTPEDDGVLMDELVSGFEELGVEWIGGQITPVRPK